MKERPIIFSGSMVRAIRDGRKTQTRRVVKAALPRIGAGAEYIRRVIRCPYGQPGDLLWVRETWAAVRPETDWETGYVDSVKEVPLGARNCRIWYRSDYGFDDTPEEREFRWRSPIRMPRRASRLTLRLTDVRVERVQDISEEDARAEGCAGHAVDGHSGYPIGYAPTDEFRDVWDAINAKRGHSWDANPWVWVMTFEPTWKNVDEVETKHPASAG